MTEHLLDQQMTAPVTLPAYDGAILGLQGDVLHGWAMDQTQPQLRPVVEIFIDGVSVALVRADQYEPTAPMGDKYHGFAVQLRQRWLDEARLITAHIANQSFALQGKLTLPTAIRKDSAGVSSQVWHTGGLSVGGWCWDPSEPSRHVQVTVREGDQQIVHTVCNKHNQALAYRATSDHGFSIDLPWDLADGEVHQLEIINDMGQPLAGSPIRLCCWPEGIQGMIGRLRSAQDAPVLDLLKRVAKEHDLRQPKSAGWNSYPEWFNAFQVLNEDLTPSMQGKLGVLLISDGNRELEERTETSISAYGRDIHELAKAEFGDIRFAIDKLITSGCDRILPMHAGDRLANFALGHLSALLDDGAAWAYADCDRDGDKGERTLPWLKPVWDIDLFIGADIFTPGAIFSERVVSEAMGLLPDYSDKHIGWHDLIAAIAVVTHRNQAKVLRLPRVLYHRSNHQPGSPEQAALSLARLKAVKWLCESLVPGTSVNPIPGHPALFRAQWPLPRVLPRVSLIVPTRDQYKLLHACIEGLLGETDYPDLEIIVVNNQSADPKTLDYLEKIKTRGVIVIDHDDSFNYSTINNRASQIATGTVIGLVNNDIEVIEPSWLKEMIAQLLRPNVGAVGAKLLWPNNMVQHGGVVVGINGLAAHTGNNLHRDDAGYLGINQLTRRQSAVTAACLLTHKELFDQLGGLDETAFPVAFNDVDLCMRILQQGKHIIWSASSQLVHAESASRGKDVSAEKFARAQREQQQFIARWGDWSDPHYHPGLSTDYLSGPYGGLSLPPLFDRNANN